MAEAKIKRVKRPAKTLKEKKFIRSYVQTGNATESASKAYNVKNRDVARNIGSQNLSKLSFPDVLDKIGVTDAKLARVLNDGLGAVKRDKDEMIADSSIRHKYMETGLKMRGHDSGQAITVNIQSNVLNLPSKDELIIPK